MSQNIEQTLDQARTLLQTGKSEEARLQLLELLKQEPDNQAALLMLGGSYFGSEKYQEAEMVFERLILMEPGRGEFSIALFNTLWKQGRKDEALEEIKRFMVTADKVKEQATIQQYTSIIKDMANNA